MKTNIINIQGKYVVKTGRVFVYETNNAPVFNEYGELVDYDEYAFSEEIIDVCSGEHYVFDGLLHLVGRPFDVFTERRNMNKRGRKSRSHNKQNARLQRVKHCFDDLPF